MKLRMIEDDKYYQQHYHVFDFDGTEVPKVYRNNIDSFRHSTLVDEVIGCPVIGVCQTGTFPSSHIMISPRHNIATEKEKVPRHKPMCYRPPYEVKKEENADKKKKTSQVVIFNRSRRVYAVLKVWSYRQGVGGAGVGCRP